MAAMFPSCLAFPCSPQLFQGRGRIPRQAQAWTQREKFRNQLKSLEPFPSVVKCFSEEKGDVFGRSVALRLNRCVRVVCARWQRVSFLIVFSPYVWDPRGWNSPNFLAMSPRDPSVPWGDSHVQGTAPIFLYVCWASELKPSRLYSKDFTE